MRRFTEEEIHSIIDDYNNGMSPKYLSIKYDRSSGCIINKLKGLGIYKCKNVRIKNEDLPFIIEMYSHGKFEEIFKKYPKLGMSSLYTKMCSLGVVSGRKTLWSEEEANFLRDNYFDLSLEELEKVFEYRHSIDSISSKAFKEFGYSTSRKWTDEENNLLCELYSNMLLNDICRYFPKRSKDAIAIHARNLGLVAFYVLDTYWTDSETEFLKTNWELLSDYDLSIALNRDQRSIKTKRNLLGLFRVSTDMRGYESLNKLVRGRITEWKKSSMKQCNYCCVITGSKEFEIHHLYPVNKILSDIFVKYNLQYKDFSEYTTDELDNIISLFIDEQNKYPFGVCVRKDIHELYHSLYGKGNNTPEQWDIFVKNLKDGKYNDKITL